MNVSIRSKYRSRFQNSETKAESRGSEGILRRSRIVKIHGGSEGEALTRPIREAVLGPRESLGLESHWPEDRECILRQVQRCKRASYEWSELCPRLPLLRRLRYCCGSFLSLPSPSPFSRAPDLPELRFVQFFLLPPMGGGWGEEEEEVTRVSPISGRFWRFKPAGTNSITRVTRRFAHA